MPNASVRLDGLRVFFYSNEHEPRHVHVTDGASVAVFELNCPAGPPTLRKNRGFALARLNRIRRELALHVPALCADWERHFGDGA